MELMRAWLSFLCLKLQLVSTQHCTWDVRVELAPVWSCLPRAVFFPQNTRPTLRQGSQRPNSTGTQTGQGYKTHQRPKHHCSLARNSPSPGLRNGSRNRPPHAMLGGHVAHQPHPSAKWKPAQVVGQDISQHFQGIRTAVSLSWLE